jgi:glyoxylase I family protein
MVSFYCDVIGCAVDRDRPELGLTHLRAGTSLIDLVVRDSADNGGRNLDHFCLQVEAFDVEAIRAHLTTHGVAVLQEGERYGAQGQGYSLYLHDPEGNTIELKGTPQGRTPPRPGDRVAASVI